MPKLHFVSRKFLKENGLRWISTGVNEPNQHIIIKVAPSVVTAASNNERSLQQTQGHQACVSTKVLQQRHQATPDDGIVKFPRRKEEGSLRRRCNRRKSTKKRTKIKFSDRLTELKAYKEKHGHLNVIGSEYKRLVNFCNKVRYARRNPGRIGRDGAVKAATTKTCIASLDALGFDWSTTSRSSSIGGNSCSDKDRKRSNNYRTCKLFADRVTELKAHKEKHGHLRVKRKDNPSLADFCANVRNAHKYLGKGGVSVMNLDEERMATLNALGFDWTWTTKKERRRTKLKLFEERVEDLKSYKERHGHLAVCGKEDQGLASFWKGSGSGGNMRMTEDRIASVDAIGFPLGRLEKHDATSLARGTVSLAEKKGIIPSGEGRLCRVAEERPVAEGGELKTEGMRIGNGEKDGEGKRRTKTFSDRVADLMAYWEKHGHLDVKRNEDKILADFCANVRHARKNLGKAGVMKLNDERIASLDNIGFNWEPRKQLFERRMKDLRLYKEKHGHLDGRTIEDKSHADFCYGARNSHRGVGSISLTKNAIDLPWDVRAKGSCHSPGINGSEPFAKNVGEKCATNE